MRRLILNKLTGEVISISSPAGWEWQEISKEEWGALFSIDIGVPDIDIYDKPRVKRLSSGYYLFDMDDELWLGEFRGEKVGMWSIYLLVPE